MAVKYTLSLINDKEVIFLQNHKKKDDLADAFLHSFVQYYGKNIPAIYKEKLEKIGDI